ncbi:MAG TPA: VOC family protein [Caulobacteraceae bacterium]|nr:VOC family protein [Caulobacteraceae bacterium]
MPKITPFLWFDKEAEEAAEFYVSIFPNSKIGKVSRYSEAGPGPKGQAMVVAFELDGEAFMALNGGPHFHFTEAVSFTVDCSGQEEVDRYWDALLAGGGKPSQCGWLKDRFGLSWQVVPRQLGELMSDANPAKAKATAEAMMKMIKLDVAALEAAHAAA